MLLVGKKYVTKTLGAVSRYAWELAVSSGVLRPVEMKIRCRRSKYLATEVERVFGLPAGSVGK